MFRTSGQSSYASRPAGEPDVWDDVAPSVSARTTPSRPTRSPRPQPASPPHRDAREVQATVEEFRTLARAIEERRGHLRRPEPAARAPLSQTSSGHAPAGYTTAGHTPARYEPDGGTRGRSASRASAAPAAPAPRTHPANTNAHPGSGRAPAYRAETQAESRFAQVHSQRQARGAQPAHVRAEWTATPEMQAAFEVPHTPPAPTPAARARQAPPPLAEPDLNREPVVSDNWLDALRHSVKAAPAQPVRAAVEPTPLTRNAIDDLTRVHEMLCELERRIQALESQRPPRSRQRSVTEMAAAGAASKTGKVAKTAGAEPATSVDPRTNGSPRRLWG